MDEKKEGQRPSYFMSREETKGESTGGIAISPSFSSCFSFALYKVFFLASRKRESIWASLLLNKR